VNILKITPVFFAAGALAACSATSYVPGVAGNAGGTYSVTQNGTTTTLPAPGATLSNGMQVWDGTAGSYKGYAYDSADVVAIALMDTASHATSTGISGTASTSVPLTSTATYTGGFSADYYSTNKVNYVRNVDGTFTSNVDFGAGTFSGNGVSIGVYNNPTLSVSGTITGAEINGTATFAGSGYTGSATAPLTGGFYGTNTLAGVFQNATVAGLIWGVTP